LIVDQIGMVIAVSNEHSVTQMSVDKMSVGQMVFNQKMWSFSIAQIYKIEKMIFVFVQFFCLFVS
jgi:hypothetical protein